MFPTASPPAANKDVTPSTRPRGERKGRGRRGDQEGISGRLVMKKGERKGRKRDSRGGMDIKGEIIIKTK